MSPLAVLIFVLVAMTATRVRSEDDLSGNVTQPPAVYTKAPTFANRPNIIRANNNGQFVMQSFSEVLQNSTARAMNNPLGMLIGNVMSKSGLLDVMPTTTTTTTTTTSTTASPPLVKSMQQMQDIGNRLFETPMRVLSGLTGGNLVRPGGPSSVNDAGRREPGAPGPTRGQRFEDDWKYYEYAGPYEPYAFRRPKYYSHECQFRFACEAGKMSKPLTHQVSKTVESNRFLQDLQNRYTRAFTYGSLRGDCERYYCVLVKMMGGPAGFAGGVAEIVNRAVNRDLYDNDGYTN